MISLQYRKSPDYLNSYLLIDGKWYRWLEGEKQETPVCDTIEELYEIYNQK